MAIFIDGANRTFTFPRENSADAVARRARQLRSTGQRLSRKDRRKRIAADKQTLPDASPPELSPHERRNWPAESPSAYRPHRPATPGSSCPEAPGNRPSPPQPRTEPTDADTRESALLLSHRLLAQAHCRDLR